MATNLHVVMVPWLAFGHLMPFFQLSLQLAKAGIRVSFVSTPANIRRLPQVPSNIAYLLELVAFPLPSLDNEQLLPQGCEATVDIPSENIQYLKIAYDLLRHPVKQFVIDQKPDWILADVIPYWVVEIAKEHYTPLVHFSVFSAAALSFFVTPTLVTGADGQKKTRSSPESWTSAPEWFDFPSPLAYPRFLATCIHEGYYGVNATGISDDQRVAKVIQASKAVAIRTCPEFEAEYLNLFEKIVGGEKHKPVFPIGLLLPEKPKGRTINDIFGWLDVQRANSVVFVGFGSECKLIKEQVQEIAYGVELSGLPFLWALRKPDWAVNELDTLPCGFRERTQGRGVVCFGWAPQMEILGHPSIGGSLFHSGWGSVIETLQFGHSLVVLPFVIDQPLNARLLVDKGLAVEIERSEDGSFGRDDIAKALRLAMVSGGGEKLRSRAREAAQVFGNRDLQDTYFNRFVEYLKENGAANQ
ncbi:putative polygalacturonase-like [Hibiscus syriacus]|uniref:Polygalacturonase-like n=1 Tax=Hibiscus syriacus TaxID=106335 RepID=A0A6A3ACQ4_HIBSY|nr:putative UDP-rhamnose:rhamnosyltransferase 1 [Hibiscus syriacus]KAE8700955.1 putative polygalacturonase-like [Hibiscus syriacus]